MITKTKKYLSMAAVIALLWITGTIMSTYSSPSASAASGAPVNIVSPLPVPVSGTVASTQSGLWNVGIAGTPTVAAAQSGSWSVGISGTPTVNLNNSVANPVIVRDADNPAQQPFVQFLCLQLAPLSGCGSLPSRFNVPAGQTFVIEQVSGQCNTTDTANPILAIQVDAELNSTGYIYEIPMQSFPGRGQTYGLKETRIYASVPSGSSLVQLGFPFFSVLPNNYECDVTLSGYLVKQS